MNHEEIRLQAQRLINDGSLHEAELLLRQTLAGGSGPVIFWQQLVRAVRGQGKFAETRALQELILQHFPGDMSNRFDLAETLLLLGDFDRGWAQYRFRYHMAHTLMRGRKVQCASWAGQPILGKTLLIHDEQGYGDTFQFLRMVTWVRERSGANVILEINQDSLTLAQRSLGAENVIPNGSLPPPFDFHIELMSLPLVMKLQLSDLPGTIPYLSADPLRVEKWRARLASLPRPLVGLVWAGRPEHINDARRSLALADLAPLAQPGVSFVSLQKGPASAQAATPPPGMFLHSLSDEIHDFEDTAAILTLLDVMVSVDSSPVHLAGALGCPAWVMLPFIPDWRWLLEREDDSPWYPSLRLFRQPGPQQWQPVLARVATALAQMTSSVCARQA